MYKNIRYLSDRREGSGVSSHLLRIMKLTSLLLLVVCMHVGATGYSQRVSLSIKDQSLEKVFRTLTKQAGYTFFYDHALLKNTKTVSLEVKNIALEDALNRCLENQPLTYSIVGKTVVIKPKERSELSLAGKQARARGLIKDITGTITDDKGNSLPGVNILIKGTTRGTTTNTDGKFSLAVDGDGSGTVLIISFIGFQTQEIMLANQTLLDIVLVSDTKQLGELVVTALGVKRDEKSLGYAVQKISGEAVQAVKGVNVATSLTGKVAGLWIKNSSEFFEAPSLTLRGATPLLVIDGIPYGNMNLTNISPDDIESIDVLKGATASALYGARGGNGAVIVTTKKGGTTKDLTVSINSNNMFFAGFLAYPEVHHSYSAGLGGVYDPSDYVWGAKLDIGKRAPQWNPETKQIEDMELTSRGKNNFRDFLEPGIISNNNISVSQTGKNGSFRASLTHIYNKGQYPNLKMNSLNFNLSGEMKVGEKFSMQSQIGYNRQMAPQTIGSGYSAQGYMYQILMWTGPEYDLSKYKDYWVVPGQKQNWMYNAWYDNPYLMAYEKLSGTELNKMNANFTANYRLFDGAKLIFRNGYDFYNDEYTKRNPAGIYSNRGWHANGMYSQTQNRGYSLNSDLLFTIDKKIGKIGVDGLAGASIYKYKDQSMYASTRGGIIIPGFYSLNNSVERPDASSNQYRKQVNSLYGKVTLSYDDFAFIDVTGRNDWSSTLPKSTRSFFYPSVGGSLVMSELINMPSWSDFWKIRGSWTVSKKDLNVYATNQSYSLTLADWDTYNSASYPTAIRSGKVDPETNRTWEIGTAAYFFKKRLQADFTYYNIYNYNIQRFATISSASGFNSTLVNIDETYVRKGVEITLNGTILRKEGLQWDATANWSTSHRYFKTLDPIYSADNLWTKEGGRYDTYTGRDWVRDPQGNLVHQANGMPLRSNYNSLFGYSDPKFIWGLTNQVMWRNFTFNLSFDGRVGGLLNNYTSYKMWDTGSHPDSDNQWRYDEAVNGIKSFIGQGTKVSSGTVVYDKYGQITQDTRVFAPNDTKISYEQYARSYGDGTFGATDATFLKLREVAIGYKLPASVIQKMGIKAASVSVTGQNVLLWVKDFRFADPDKADDTQLTSPSNRYVGVNLQLTF